MNHNKLLEPIEAIILAAGYSSRATTFKMSLPLGQQTVLEHTLSKFAGVCNRVIVVAGYKQNIIEAIVTDLIKKNTYSFELKFVFNESFDQGMFSSIQRGCQEVNAPSFFITPGDCPLVKRKTIQLLAEEKGIIVVPSHNFKAGHPIKLTNAIKNQILKASPDSNLREILQNHEKTYLNVGDPGVLIDLDTSEDYKKVVEYYRRNFIVK
mgnify:CR=1 FL=1